MAASHQDATGAALLSRVMYWWNGTSAVPANASTPMPITDAGNSTRIGAGNETAPASDTASSGLNGRLQRIAQRLTSLIALLPAALATGGGLKTSLTDAAGNAVSFDGITSVAKIDSAAANTNATSVKASPGRVLGVECKVVRASDVFLKIFNVTGTPVPGTDAVRDQIRLPLSSNVNLTFGDGIYCSTGIGIALTTGVAENDTGALTAGDVTAFRIRYA